jgi:5'-3' exonuclease
VFYRYYATYNWLKKYVNPDIVAENILENEVFMDKYPKMFEKTLCDIVKTHKVSWDNVFLVKDCLRESIWRMSFYAGYKGTRDDRLDTFNKEIFRFTYVDLVPKLYNKYKFTTVSHPHLEADDIIALMKNKIRVTNPFSKVTIITNDNDYIQLIDGNTYVINLQGKEIKYRVGVSPDLYLKAKIIMGDKSDNIPCIMRKVGPKTAEKLAQDKANFDNFCEKYPDAKRQYELNRLLIDLSLIPSNIKDGFMERIVTKHT